MPSPTPPTPPAPEPAPTAAARVTLEEIEAAARRGMQHAAAVEAHVRPSFQVPERPVILDLATVEPEDGRYYPGLAAECLKTYRLIIDAVREAARACGYALAVHGSLARDIDLIAVPWTEDAASAEEVAEAIRRAAEQANPRGLAFLNPRDPEPRVKPHGRLGWAIHLGHGPYIDLSVMPRRDAAHDALAREVETLRRERDDARSLVAEVAAGVTHYQGPGGCGDPGPCVRCRAEAAEARLREAADTCPVCAAVCEARAAGAPR